MNEENTSNAPTTTNTKKPRIGSRAWEESLADSPIYHKNRLSILTEQAARGCAEAIEDLKSLLTRFPEFRKLIRQLDDLTTRAENAWVAVLAGNDKLTEESVRKEIDEMKSELLGDHSTIIDRIVAGSVIVSYLAHQRAAMTAAKPAESPAIAAMRDCRAESAQKRLLRAVKGLQLVRGKAAKGIHPAATVRLFAEG